MSSIPDILKDNRISTIFKLTRQAFGQYKLQIIVLTVLGFLGGLLGGIGISAIIPLFSFVVGQDGGGDNIISQKIEEIFLYFNIDFNIKYLLIFISVLFVFKAITLVIFSYISNKITTSYVKQTRGNLLNIILKADWPYLLEQKLGHLETVLMVNVENSAGLLGQISNIIITVTTFLVYIFIAIKISLYITLITLISGLIFFLFLKPIIFRLREMSYEVERINREVSHHVNENIMGMKTVKVMSVGNKVTKIGKEYFCKLKEIQNKSFLLNSIIGAFMEPFSLIFICIVFALSYKSSSFNFASLAVVIYLIKQIFVYFQQLQKRLIGVNSTVPYLKSVLYYENQAIKHKEQSRGNRHFQFNKILEFKNINFSYVLEKEVLHNINFRIKRGEMVGLIGPSGAGKTTLVDLILRLLNPISGAILLDGKNIKGIDIENWRKNIGYVSQDIFLKNGTIAENIKFYDESISQEEIEAAAKMANIYDFVENCPDKFNTAIGERGVLLSGGQKQRIVIARVLVRKPKFLILDEATNALDNESETKIQEVIENLKGKITVLVIAHRLSTIINCDRLIVLDDGKIIEEGNPQELLNNKKSYFFKVYNIRETNKMPYENTFNLE